MPKCLKCGAGPEWLQGKIPNELPEELKRKTDCAEPKHEDVVYCLQCSDRDISALEKKLANALLQIDELKKELAREEQSCAEVMAERDRWEDLLGELAAEAGCQEEWSNLHAHGDCITNEWDAKLKEKDRLISEMRTALEIAFPSMAHTYSGHEDPSRWAEGCGKCRVGQLLTNPIKREVIGQIGPDWTTCGPCGTTHMKRLMCPKCFGGRP